MFFILFANATTRFLSLCKRISLIVMSFTKNKFIMPIAETSERYIIIPMSTQPLRNGVKTTLNAMAHLS
jgi:hypothetical protein